MAQLEILQIEYKSPEWYAMRRNGIGGSDAAAAIGRSTFKTNVELWEEKTGRKTKNDDLSDNPRVQYGTQAEAHLTELFALDYPEYEVIDQKDKVYRRGFMFASLDAGLIERATGRKGFLEDKTAVINSRATAEKWEGNSVPEMYYIQLLHCFITTGWDFCKLKARLIDNDRYGERLITEKHYHFERGELIGDMKYLFREEKAFWEYVEAGRRPPRILPQI